MQNPDYQDAIALALSRTRHDRLRSDPALWQKMILSFKNATAKEAPELFADVHFDIRNPERPYSEQIDGFLAGMRWKGALILWPGGEESAYEMPKLAKQSINEGQSRNLSGYVRIINDMANIIDETLGVD
ncbi:MAG: hypothetical protein HYT11_01990 [Candidatus Levybacteria bacterium]|nr:hypothetical protein [Candidatus Levybacteria bacterium]